MSLPLGSFRLYQFGFNINKAPSFGAATRDHYLLLCIMILYPVLPPGLYHSICFGGRVERRFFMILKTS